jgi:hypothetical protein
MFHGRAVRMGAAGDRISRLCNLLSQLARTDDRTEMQGQKEIRLFVSESPNAA